jgi:hypothetical protein
VKAQYTKYNEVLGSSKCSDLCSFTQHPHNTKNWKGGEKEMKKIMAIMIVLLLIGAVATVAVSAKAEKGIVVHKGKTITVACPALAAHQRHGDVILQTCVA